MFYGIYYYAPGSTSVYLLGFYDDLQKAKKVLGSILPNYKPNYNNSVRGDNGLIGWINQYTMNCPSLNLNISADRQLACNQPHSSVNLFDNIDQYESYDS